MPLFKNRPLCALCAVFLLCIFLSICTDGAAIPYVAALSVLSLCALPFLRRCRRPILTKRNARFVTVCALLSLLSLCFSYFAYLRPVQALPLDAGEVKVEARVEEVLFESNYAFSCYASLQKIDEEGASGRILVEGDFGKTLTVGMQISFYATLSPLSGDDAIYSKSDGCIARAQDLRDFSSQYGEPTLPQKAAMTLHSWRQALCARLRGAVPGESGRLLSAMLLGDKDALSDTTVRDFRRLGLSHILSISGLHLQILVFLLFAVCKRLFPKRRPALVISILVILFYVSLIGFKPSAVRAGLMAICLSISFMVREQNDSLTTLFLSATLFTLFSPATVYDVGFLLSCFATLGILVLCEFKDNAHTPRHPLARLLRAALSLLFITLAASLATLPITALLFGEFSLLSPLANLLLTPLFSFYLLLAPLALLLAPIPPIGEAIAAVGDLFIKPVSLLADLPNVLISVSYRDFVFLAFLFAALFFLCLCVMKSRRKIALVGGAMLATLALCLGASTLSLFLRQEVRYENESGNEYLLLLDEGKAMICEATNGASRARYEVQDLLQKAHLCELEGYFLTHYHARHPSTLESLFGAVKVRSLYLPTPTTAKEEEIYRACVALAQEHGVSFIRYEAAKVLSFEAMTLTPLGICEAKESTHPTFALTVALNGQTLTYLSSGAAEGAGATAAAAAVKASNAVILGDHGPREESYIAYAQWSPRIARVIISNPQARLHPPLYTLFVERGVLGSTEKRVLPL